MTERERLFNLLRENKKLIPLEDDRIRLSVISDVTDHLLANNVTILPCKLGDDLYFNPTPNEIRKSPFTVALIALAEDGWYLSNSFDVDDALYHFDKINTHESYLSKELLEQALKERERE